MRRSLALEADCYGPGQKGVHLWGNPFYWSRSDGDRFQWELEAQTTDVAKALYALMQATAAVGELIQLCDLLALEVERQGSAVRTPVLGC
ncbi:MAG: hypothetical protein WBM08_14985 [Prochlorococcaceae cyanobacterium]